MEFSSPPLDLQGFSSPVDETHRQPTYTTVGSVYSGSASLLKPPTRRCRTQRYPGPVYESPSGDAGINALLSALKDQTPTSPPTTANSFQQYSPLQQNYDRALSPEELDLPILTPLAMAQLTARSGNVPPPEFNKQDAPALPGQENMVSETALQGLSVRTLNSLASYPNRMQNIAKRQLERGRNAGISRGDTPSSLSCSSSDYAKDRDGSMYGSLHPNAGAPAPLTAGPPGQRQYKPSTFEGTVKALNGTAPYAQRVSPTPEYGNHSYESMPGTDASVYEDYGPASTRASTPRDFRSDSVSTEPLSVGTQTRLFHNAMKELDGGVIETLHIDAVRQYYPKGFPPGIGSKVLSRPQDSADKFHHERQTNLPLSPEDIERRHQEVDKKFYSGIDRLYKDIAQIKRDHDHATFQKELGVIGGERQRAKTMDRRPLDVSEACRMGIAQHAEPLLNMAYGTLLSYKEEACSPNAWRSGFVKVDAHLIDTEPNGNKSFFEQPKRKRVKKVRRGY